MNKKLLLGIDAVAIMATSAVGIYAKANKGLITRAAGTERTIMFEYSKNTDFKDSSMTSSQTELGYDVDCLFYANQSETYSFGAKDEVFKEERWFVSKDYDTTTVWGGSQICAFMSKVQLRLKLTQIWVVTQYTHSMMHISQNFVVQHVKPPI